MKRGHASEPCSCAGGCTCGCCEGVAALTPLPLANRPGLPALVYRVGTWSSFLETMKARLSSAELLALARLTTREEGDPSIALLDAWAVVADVLTFYQERIANEGYLRTATERRSVLELARLVGYTLRPGVASSVHLAYTLEEKPKPIPAPATPGAPVAVASASVDEPEIVIPKGSRVQSVPGPGELPQPFETSDDLVARAVWNRLQVRLTQPQQPDALRLAKSAPAAYQVVVRLVGSTPGGSPAPYLRIDAFLDDANKNSANSTRTLANGTFDLDLPQNGETINVEISGVSKTPTLYPIHLKLAFQSRGFTLDLELDANKQLTVASRGPEAVPPTVRRTTPKWGEAVSILALRRTPVYFQGIATSLKPNDLLLIDTGSASGSDLYRVTRVEPDAPRDRTRVEVEAWMEKRPAGPLASLLMDPDPPDPPRSRVQQLHQVLGSGLDSLQTVKSRSTAKFRTVSLLNTLQTSSLAAGVDEATLQEQIAATLDQIQKEQASLSRSRPTALSQQLDSLISELAPLANLPLARMTALTVSAAPALGGLTRQPAPQPRNSLELTRDVKTLFATGSDLPTKLLTVEFPELRDRLYVALANAPVTPAPVLGVCALRTRASVFGHNAPLVTQRDANGNILSSDEWNLKFPPPPTPPPSVSAESDTTLGSLSQAKVTASVGELVAISVPFRPIDNEDPNVVYLDNTYPQITPGGWIVLLRPNSELSGTPLVIARIEAVSEQSRAACGISGKTTRVVLDRPWLRDGDEFAVIRGTAVYAQCENLPLAEEPIPDPLCGSSIELAGLYDGLASGRWLIVSGERADLDDIGLPGVVGPVPGVPAAELAMLAGVTQGVAQDAEGNDLPGERNHTTLTLKTPLAYCYRRDTLTIYGNVARATHGETKAEVLGSGDASKVFQSFTLRQPPLTYVSAPTTSGVSSTLEVRVNDLLWHEAASFADLGPADRGYITKTDAAAATTVVFGNGVRGALLPTGTVNVRAKYRAGIGKPGNVKAGQISQLVTRPLGVKDVVNPLLASGGADAESRDQARGNAPLAVMALDRLVSVADYAAFARTFAGVGKASAARLSDGRVQLVHVTIAGDDDIPILESSDLFVNLGLALSRFGDPRQPVELAVRDRRLLTISANVQLLPDYEWETVEPRIRAALLSTFGYANRDLGQYAFLSEAQSAIQGVRGVDYADVDVFDRATGSVDPEKLQEQLTRLGAHQPKKRVAAHLARPDEERPGHLLPAQLIYLSPDVPDTLILKEKKP